MFTSLSSGVGQLLSIQEHILTAAVTLQPVFGQQSVHPLDHTVQTLIHIQPYLPLKGG